MTELPIYQVDAFTDRLFGGNPAAVVPLTEWLPDATMQRIAAETHLPATAFFRREGEDYAIRWFTPRAELPLCGHGTLASAFIILTQREPGRPSVTFRAKSGAVLAVERRGAALAMSLAADQSAPCPAPPGLAEALGATPRETLKGARLLAVFAEAADVVGLKPDLAALHRFDRGTIVTAPGDHSGTGEFDFVSRMLAPAPGVDEDHVTGSSHAALVPFWSARLGKTAMRAHQASPRGGVLQCEIAGETVTLIGTAVLFMSGAIRL